ISTMTVSPNCCTSTNIAATSRWSLKASKTRARLCRRVWHCCGKRSHNTDFHLAARSPRVSMARQVAESLHREVATMPPSFSCLVLFVAIGVARAEPDVHDTRLLTYPAVSAHNVAFVYADDLFIADLDGRNVRRLTSDIGVESHPVFAPDGKTIAFSAQYDGNTDVYTIPVDGGSPTRLTWHPDADIVRGWTPDSKAVLFSSGRNVFTNRYTQLFTVPVGGGMPTQLPIPHAVEACYSPEGEYVAYTPLGDRSGQWKNYRGGTHSRILIYRCKDHQVEQI